MMCGSRRKDGRMSKGIIVTDEIPENCFHCGIKRRPSGMSFPEDMVCGITGQSVYQYNPHNLTGDKPDWCPIRPIPEKKEIRGITFSSGYAEWNLNGQDRGWNDCIDELLKDGG